MKESGLEHSVPISWKWKFIKISWIVFTALQNFLNIYFTLSINTFGISLTLIAISHCFEDSLKWLFWPNMSNTITIEEHHNHFHKLVVYFSSIIYIFFQNLQEWCLRAFSVHTYRHRRSWHWNLAVSSVEKHLKLIRFVIHQKITVFCALLNRAGVFQWIHMTKFSGPGGKVARIDSSKY